ncbi:hypothetical protein IKF34_02605 [Candidatus Saccharibacteria bacterium]|nr:hypothetical protein [Candidatus Saccharibacteria bacterium]
MNRLIIVYNPRSSRFSDVKKEVLDKVTSLKGYMIGKYEVEKTNVDDNAKKLAKLLQDGDLVISAGGDATAIVASNAILRSNKSATLAVLPYGNFNDLSRTLGIKNFDRIFTWTGDAAGGTPAARRRTSSTVGEAAAAGPVQKLYPLEIYVDGELFRYATCYATIGMIAESVEIYDVKKTRQKLKTRFGRFTEAYFGLSISRWYFKNRHKKNYLPEFKLNGRLQSKKTSDYIAINGRYMARVLKSPDYSKKPKLFRSQTFRLVSFPRLFRFMATSILYKVPATDTKGDTIEFLKPATIAIQTEGEQKIFRSVTKIEIRKSENPLKVIRA